MKNMSILKNTMKLFTAVGTAALLMTSPVNAKADVRNGVYQNNAGVWSYYENGSIDSDYTGIASTSDGRLWYVTDGAVDFDYFGVADDKDGTSWYVLGGEVIKTFTNVSYSNGEWVCIQNGKWNKEYTGLAQNENGWWYINNGVVDFNYAGYVEYDGSEWCVSGGTINFDVVSIVPWENQWYKIVNGRWDKDYIGVAQNENGWWYVNNGLVDFTYTGLASNERGTWYIDNGEVDFSANGTVTIDGQVYRCDGGLCDTSYAGVVLHHEKWMYLYNNAINSTFTGIASNEQGQWYLVSGEVAFDYTGKVEYQGVTYHITDGFVDGVGTFTGIKLVDGQRLYYNEGVNDISYNGNAKDTDGLLWHVKNGVVDGSVGVDVSSYQGDIDWDKVQADGIQFAVIRIGFGDDIASQDDKKAIRNMDECERIGMPYGVYLYSYAVSEAEAVSEKDHILRMLEGRNPSMGVYLDIEDTAYYQKYGLDPYSTEGKARIMKYISIVMDGISPYYKAGVYANYNYFTNVINKNEIDEMKWLAIYGRGDCPTGDWDMWQYTSTGSVDGISGNVDMNIWYR